MSSKDFANELCSCSYCRNLTIHLQFLTVDQLSSTISIEMLLKLFKNVIIL